MNARMKVINQSRVALMKTFYNFVVLLSMQQHNISESVSLILVPKSGKFQTCAGRATTLITVLPYPLISHIRCGVLFIHPHIGFSRTSEQMNGQLHTFALLYGYPNCGAMGQRNRYERHIRLRTNFRRNKVVSSECWAGIQLQTTQRCYGNLWKSNQNMEKKI